MSDTDQWYWAAAKDGPAADRFVIANGTDALWSRGRAEVDSEERCFWNPVNRDRRPARTADILEMLFTVVPTYRVNQNRFVIEAAHIPVFARFLKDARHDLGNYVSNSLYPEELASLEPYSNDATAALGRVVAATLNCDPDWWVYIDSGHRRCQVKVGDGVC